MPGFEALSSLRELCVRILVLEDERKLAASIKHGPEAEVFAVDVVLTGDDRLWRARETVHRSAVHRSTGAGRTWTGVYLPPER